VWLEPRLDVSSKVIPGDQDLVLLTIILLRVKFIKKFNLYRVYPNLGAFTIEVLNFYVVLKPRGSLKVFLIIRVALYLYNSVTVLGGRGRGASPYLPRGRYARRGHISV